MSSSRSAATRMHPDRVSIQVSRKAHEAMGRIVRTHGTTIWWAVDALVRGWEQLSPSQQAEALRAPEPVENPRRSATRRRPATVA